MSHYNVNGGVPKTLIQHLIRWVIAPSSSTTRRARSLERPGHRDHPGAGAGAEGERRRRAPRPKVGPYALQDFTLFHVLRYGFRAVRIAFLARHAWSDAAAGAWPPGFAEDQRTAYDLAEIRHWLEVFCQRFFAFSQFKRSALPNGPKVSPAARCPRAATGGRRRTSARAWLDEIHREVPED